MNLFCMLFMTIFECAVAGDLYQIRRDLNEACQISKEARTLASSKYKSDPNALNIWIQNQMKLRIKTDEILNLSSTIGMVEKVSRQKLWNQTSRDLEVKNWSCPGIGEFL